MHGSLLSLGVRPNTVGETRIGLRTKRGLKGAVVRNRLKRQLRAVVSQAGRHLRPGAVDIIVVVHPKQPSVTFGELAAEFDRLGRRARLLTT